MRLVDEKQWRPDETLVHCAKAAAQCIVHFMTRRSPSIFRALWFLFGLFVFMVPYSYGVEPSPAASASFDSYCAALESRLAGQHRSQSAFLAGPAMSPQNQMRLLREDPIIEELTPAHGADLQGALLHHWRGTAFVRGATTADFERLMRDFSSYPRHFSPQVLQAKLLSRNADHLQASMRIVQHHVLTVVMDTTYDIVYGRLDAQHGYSLSRSTKISEVASPGTPKERPLPPAEEHGFLWRLNTYWSYEERDGGLYIQIETISLTRSIPTGLGWAVGPFVESIPRESLEFTLRSTCKALRTERRQPPAP
jgi:hypothetical protein